VREKLDVPFSVSDKQLVKEVPVGAHRVLALGRGNNPESDSAAPALRLAQEG
jgi:hypothetical protein